MSMSLKPQLIIHHGLRMTPRLRRHIAADALKARSLLPEHNDEQQEKPASREAGTKSFSYAE